MNKRPPTLQIFQQNKKLKQALVCEPPMTQGPNSTQDYMATQPYNPYPQQQLHQQHNNYKNIQHNNYKNIQHNNHQGSVMASNQASHIPANSIPSHIPANSIPSYQPPNSIPSHQLPNSIHSYQPPNSIPSQQPDNFYSHATQQSQVPGNQYNQYNQAPHSNNMNGNHQNQKFNSNQNYSSNLHQNNQYSSNQNNANATPYNPNSASVQYNPHTIPSCDGSDVVNGHSNPHVRMGPNNQAYPSPYPNHQIPANQPSYNQPSYNQSSYKQQPGHYMTPPIPNNNFGYNSGYASVKATTATSLITSRPLELKVEKKTQSAKPAKRGERTISCTISSLLHWSKYSEQCPILFELYACVESVEESSGVCTKFIVTDSDGGRLQCVYYTMGADIPPILHAKHYRLLGKMTGSGKLQCVKVAQVNYNSASPDLVKQSNVSMSKFVLQLNEQ